MTPPKKDAQDLTSAAGAARHGAILEDLGSGIVAGRFPVGEILPPIEALSQRYSGASRATIREAIRVLAAKGLVRPRQRVGTIVLPREEWQLFDRDLMRWLSAAQGTESVWRQLICVRLLIEPEIAATAATRATPDDVAHIADALAAMAEHRGTDASIDPDLAFHYKVARASHNEFLAHLARTMMGPLAEAFALTLSHPEASSQVIPEHQAILRAIERGDAEGARRASRRQLEKTRSMLDELPGAKG